MDSAKTSEEILQALSTGGADLGECSVSEGNATEIYYESGKISMVRSVLNHMVVAKAIQEQKKGIYSTNELTPDTAREAAAAALESAQHAPMDPAEGISEPTENASFSRGVASADRDRLYNLLHDFLETVRAEYPKISFDSVSVGHACSDLYYSNTNGVRLHDTNGYYSFSAMFMAKEDDLTSSFLDTGFYFTDLETPLIERGMLRTMLAEAQEQIRPQTLNGKFVGDLIVTPACLGDFLRTAQSNFLSDSSLIDGTSLWKDAMNRSVASDLLTWRALPESPEIPAADRLTGDGYVARDMTIIENGILRNFCLSRYGAAKTGLQRSMNTGDAYVVESGDTGLEQMIASVENGLLLNRISGGQPASNGDFSSVAKNSFLIRNGKIVGAVTETMITGNIAAMLKNIVTVSKERISDGAGILPWVRMTGVTISGQA